MGRCLHLSHPYGLLSEDSQGLFVLVDRRLFPPSYPWVPMLVAQGFGDAFSFVGRWAFPPPYPCKYFLAVI